MTVPGGTTDRVLAEASAWMSVLVVSIATGSRSGEVFIGTIIVSVAREGVSMMRP